MNQLNRAPRRAPRWALLAALLVIAASLVPAHVEAAPLQQASGGPDAGDEIVYIDGNEKFIRVLDTVQKSGPLVQWVSPTAGWTEIALGDVNADGDMEIIAITDSGGNNKLTIFDPVVANASVAANGKINGIPWAILYEMALPNRPRLVLAGDFDVGVPGDEFLVGYDLSPGQGDDPNDFFRMQIYKQPTQQAGNGKAWAFHVGRDTEERWERGAVGQFVPGGPEEFAIVDEDGDDPNGDGTETVGKMEIHRVDQGWRKITDYGDSKRPFADVAFGQWDAGSNGIELASVRNPDIGQIAAFIFEYDESDPDSPKEPFTSAFQPPPRRVAMADVDADGEDEMFLLRNAPGTLARLIGRNRGRDNIVTWEDRLGDSNDFRSITGGDVDGDGQDELILARAAPEPSGNDIIRIYRNADVSTDDKQDVSARNNRRTLLAGNLNAIGFTEGAVFAVDKTLVEVTTPMGESAQATFRLRNATTPQSVAFSLRADGNPPWLTMNPSSGRTPSNNGEVTVQLTFNSAGLQAGVYRSRIYIDSSDEVVNKGQISVVITFNVEPARFLTTPAALYFPLYEPMTTTVAHPATGICTEPTTDTVPVSQTVPIVIYGTQGISYTAAIIDSPTFAAASAALGDSVNGAAITEEGDVVLTNPNGEWVTLPKEFSTTFAAGAAAVQEDWPSGVPWLSAESTDGVTPDTMRLTFDPSQLNGTGEQRAYIVLIGDPRTGSPPLNARFIQVFACVEVRFLPSVTN